MLQNGIFLKSLVKVNFLIIFFNLCKSLLKINPKFSKNKLFFEIYYIVNIYICQMFDRGFCRKLKKICNNLSIGDMLIKNRRAGKLLACFTWIKMSTKKGVYLSAYPHIYNMITYYKLV